VRAYSRILDTASLMRREDKISISRDCDPLDQPAVAGPQNSQPNPLGPSEASLASRGRRGASD
jgi:hypothetical protein